MIRTRSEPSERDAATPSWWTPRRTKAASFCGLVGGLGVLGAVGFAGGAPGPGGGFGVGSLLYPVWHVLLAIAVLAADARYGSGYGRSGSSVAVLTALSLVGYAVLTIVLQSAGPAALGDLFLPLGGLVGTTYVAIRLFGSVYGITRWRRNGGPNANRLTAGLFVALLPSMFVLGAGTQFGVPAWAINAPLAIAFVALSYDLWTADEIGSPRETGVSDS